MRKPSAAEIVASAMLTRAKQEMKRSRPRKKYILDLQKREILMIEQALEQYQFDEDCNNRTLSPLWKKVQKVVNQ